MKSGEKTPCRWRHAMLGMATLAIAACGSPRMNDQQMVEAAKAYLTESKLREAAIELKNALQENPQNAEARYLLGQVNLDVGDVAGAEKEFRRAAEAGWKEHEVQIALARALINRSAFQRVIDDIVIKDTYPAAARADLYALRASAQAGLGELDQARATLASAAEIDAGAFQVVKTTVELQLAAGDIDAAARSLKHALSAYPDNPELRLLSATVAIRSQDQAAAAEAYTSVIDQAPAKLVTFNGRQARLGLARLQILDAHLEQAQGTLAPLFKQIPNDPETNYLGGMLAFEQDNLGLAEERLLKVLKVAPDHPETQLLFATVKYVQKDYEQAAYYLSKYVSAVPENLGARKLLGRTYLMLGQHDEAQEALQVGTKETTEDAELLALVGLARLQGGETASGIEGLQQALEVAPDSAAIRGELAKAYIAAGETERAILELNRLMAKGGEQKQTESLLVLAHLRAGNIDKATSAALDMLARTPGDPAILTLVGNVFAAGDDKLEAREYFAKALQLKSGFVPATMSLARLEELEGNVAEATALYQGAADSDAQSIAPLLELARLAENAGQTQDMVEWLEKARERAPQNVMPRLMLAEHYLREKQLDKAGALVEEALKIAPGQPVLLTMRGRVAIGQGRYNEALSTLTELVSKQPSSAPARTLLAQTYMELGQINEAREQLERALEKQADYVPALVILVRTDLKSGDFEAAVASADKIQKAQPELSLGYELAGDAWMANNDFAQAKAAYAQAWERNQTAEMAIKVSDASMRSGHPEDAVDVLSGWLKDHPHSTRVRESLATAYQVVGQNARAVQEYQQVLEQQADNVVALNNLAWLYSRAEDTQTEAIALAEKAYQVNPNDAGIQDTYGWILVQQGQVDKGRRLLEQAMKTLSALPEVRYHYAVAVFKSGEETRARQMLAELLREHAAFEGREEAEQLVQ